MKKSANSSSAAAAGDNEAAGPEGLDPRLQSLSENLKIHQVFNEEINLHVKQFVKLLDDLVSESTVISVEYQKYSEQLSDQDFSVSSKLTFSHVKRVNIYYFHLLKKRALTNSTNCFQLYNPI